MKEIQIHAYSRLSSKTIIKIDNIKIEEQRKLTPAERYIRNYTLEGDLLSNIEKNPALLEAKPIFNKRMTTAANRLKDSGTIEEESGLTHKINYGKLPDLVKKTQSGRIFELIDANPNGLTRKAISGSLGYTHASDIDNMLESGLLEKGQIRKNGKWTNIIFSHQYSEEIKREQLAEEKMELTLLCGIIEKQLNKQDKKVKNQYPISTKILEIIDTTPALNIRQASKYDVGLDSPYHSTKKINELIESGSIIVLNSEDLGIIVQREYDKPRQGHPTVYLFSRGYFEKYLEEKKLLQSSEIKTKMMSDIEKRKKEFKKLREQTKYKHANLAEKAP